jgi:peroxiredoxin family protein
VFPSHDRRDDKYTTWNSDDDNKGFQNIIRIDDSDPEKSTIYYLGYTNKHNNSRRDQKDFTQQEITDAVKEYHSIKRISHRPEKNNNIKLITNKNIYQNIISFVENPENDTSYDDRYLKYKTIKAGFGYSQVSDKTEEKVFQELRIMNNQEWKNDKEISNLKSIPQQETVDIYKYEELQNRTQNDIEFLMVILQNQNLSLPPQDIARIKNISYLYKIHEKC